MLDQKISYIVYVKVLNWAHENTRIVRLCLFSRCLMEIKLLSTSSNIMQHGQTSATCWIQRCWTMLHQHAASVWPGLKLFQFNSRSTVINIYFTSPISCEGRHCFRSQSAVWAQYFHWNTFINSNLIINKVLKCSFFCPPTQHGSRFRN